jgi:hypothetical protein
MATIVEVPVLSEEERAEFLASLAEADIAAGRAKTFAAGQFDEWLKRRAMAIRANKA